MSRIDKLIAELCPDGVPYRPLGEVFETKNGYTPPKSDPSNWTNGTVPWFRMEDIRENGGILEDAIQHIPESAVKGGRLFPPDSIIVATSATVGEHALIRVPFLSNQRFTAMWPRPKFRERLDMKFVYYYCFILDDWCKKNTTTSSFASVDMCGFKKFRIPVPPLEVQREIVRILDLFTTLEAELEAELEARRRQYAHYRDSLLTFPEGSVRWATLGEVGTIFGGLTGKSKTDFANGNARYVSYTNVFNHIAIDTVPDDFVRVASGERQRALRRGDVLFTGSSESADEVAVSSVVTAAIDEPLYLNSFCIGFRPHDPDLLYPDFAKHLFRSAGMRRQLVKTASGVTRFNVSKRRLAQVRFPVPSLEEQRRIAAILDKFDALVNDLSSGLPAEIAARRQQYEYYRDRLLVFKETAS